MNTGMQANEKKGESCYGERGNVTLPFIAIFILSWLFQHPSVIAHVQNMTKSSN